ncbi:MAG TPA: thioredoxin domain-containing protein [Verrucomicrobiota bacterium]|nr:thioredoxin domain-containing protein [Verrucomicrobiota bacterium]
MTDLPSTASAPARHTNRLAQEKSPYLLQHAHNPVDWFPWGEAAFDKARAEDKPIFLSIGYSTCHWCHVMERESFENDATAAVLNKNFICIKLDREERPDVDKIYMTFVQSTSGGGGWPLNVFLTPELKPFYGGTYWPPEAKYGRPSFSQVLQRVAELWKTQRADVLSSAADLTAKLQSLATYDANNAFPAGERELHGAGQTFLHEYDSVHGGFGSAPKFPRPSQPLYLLRYGKRFGDTDALKAVLHTCEAMAAGGMNDQLGGGFARYSVDERWLVPHFEKMLYDQAQLTQLYLDAYLVSGEARHAEVARATIRYVARDLKHPDGGFYSAEDADSEGKEGKFYCWTREEFQRLLTPEEFTLAARYFGVTAKGNFVDHSDPHPLPDQNILSIVDVKLNDVERPLLESAKAKLFAARSKRVRPHLDDKVLAAWNGMMLGAVARAAVVLGDAEFKDLAERNLAFLKAKLWDASTKTLYSRWRDGERDQVQLLDAYANLLAGVTDLYEATVDPRHLQFAVELAESMMARFYDTEAGGFWQTSADTPHLLLRHKEDYDGAEPSGNSVATLTLLRLAVICERKDWRTAAEKSIRLFAQRLHQFPQAVPHLLLALDFGLQEPRRIVLVGDFSCGSTTTLLRAAHGVFQPHRVILGNAGPVEPFAKTLPINEEFTQVYCCSGTACQPPTRDRDAVRAFLVGK